MTVSCLAWMVSQLPDFIKILTEISHDAALYLPLFFIYSILAVIILPIPIEAGLFNPYINPVFLVLTLAAGKSIGGFSVFYIGSGISSLLHGKASSHILAKKIVHGLERFVQKTGMPGLLILLSIPLMVDTIPVYLYALLITPHEKKIVSAAVFAGVNFIAGIIRATIVLAIASLFGFHLV
jgi:hypothetical protein